MTVAKFNDLWGEHTRYRGHGDKQLPTHEAIHKMFLLMRPKMLEHIGAVTYT